MITTSEENNYPKAIAISAGLMALFIALSFIWVISAFKPEEPPGMGGMVVNYGTSATGIGSDYTSIEEPSMDPNANNKLPDKVTPEQKVTPTTSSQVDAKDVVTQNSEDAVAINTKATKNNNAPTSATEAKPAQPTINPNALYKGNKNNGKGQGDGTGTTPGNQGSINGDPLAPNYGEGGSGNGNTPIPLSRFNNLVTPKDNGQQTGKIAIKAFYNREGRITNAQVYLRTSTLMDPELQQKCLQAVLNSSLSKNEIGGTDRSGIVTFYFKVN
ncbi:energy transducer TonB [Pedobacter sp. LMG 31464]|uniref:Energy transducer TonB n=1 Tax=Pedobacter planticolens TaxID=2679964 RepID=A0A923DWZ5_9SPHI|nr:energy transducer TonB [Pedobacter planticolens]MBB2145549.1 energy transducer TonB [Pedobacter planticolens]